MKNNLKFFLALGNAKLVMLNNAGHNDYYGKTYMKEYNLYKIVSILNNR